MLIFVLFVFAWAFIGFLGMVNAKEDRIDYEILIFLGIVPFIPLIAKLCGMY